MAERLRDAVHLAVSLPDAGGVVAVTTFLAPRPRPGCSAGDGSVVLPGDGHPSHGTMSCRRLAFAVDAEVVVVVGWSVLHRRS